MHKINLIQLYTSNMKQCVAIAATVNAYFNIKSYIKMGQLTYILDLIC